MLETNYHVRYSAFKFKGDNDSEQEEIQPKHTTSTMKNKDCNNCKFTYKRLSLRQQNEGTALQVETIRLKDICKSCRMFLRSSEQPVYVYGCIHPESMCATCLTRHQMEIEVTLRKAVLACDLCPKCLALVQDPQPGLCKVWGGILEADMCNACQEHHLLNPDCMIDPGTLCLQCVLRTNSTDPEAKPVKGGIDAEAVCNECKRKSRATNRDCAIDLASLCRLCVLKVRSNGNSCLQSIRYLKYTKPSTPYRYFT